MKKQNLLLILLAFGLLFSTTLELKFNLHNGFNIIGLWIKPTFQFLDFAEKSSNELFLTSQLVGYIFYLIFGVEVMKSPDFGNWADKAFIAAFFSLVSLVLVNDFYSYYQEITGQFTGRHLRMGLTVFMVGVLIIQKLKVNSLRRQIAE